jgi:hypothetical protein
MLAACRGHGSAVEGSNHGSGIRVGKVTGIERVAPRPGAVEKPWWTEQGYCLADPRHGRDKHRTQCRLREDPRGGEGIRLARLLAQDGREGENGRRRWRRLGCGWSAPMCPPRNELTLKIGKKYLTDALERNLQHPDQICLVAVRH